MDNDILKEELLKNPFQIDNKIHTQTLYTEFLKYGKIINEISSRWLIVSPFNCKSCQRKIEPLNYRCPTCNIPHHDDYDDRLKELKITENNYVETNRDIYELSNLKWTYKLSESDLNDYLNSLAPMIGEIQFEYRERLFKEWWETCAIMHIIRSEWNIYFENICMNCGDEFEPYNLHCPS